MITTELLSAVLGLKVHKVIGLDGSTNQLRYSIYPSKGDDPSDYTFPINIYELAHKCKEWAYTQGYIISSGLTPVLGVNRDGWAEVFSSSTPLDGKLHTFKQLSEPEAVFAACQWLLEQQSSEKN